MHAELEKGNRRGSRENTSSFPIHHTPDYFPRMKDVSSTPSKKRKGPTNVLEDDEQISVKMDPYYLHCSICNDPLDREAGHHLFQCTNGHVMCTPCASKVANTCPECPAAAVNRCLVLENIIDGLRKPCTFSPHGCTEFVSQAEKPAHEARCSHAPSRCLASGCAWTGSENLIAEHIREDHGRLCSSFNINKVFCVKFIPQEAAHFLKGNDGSLFALMTRSAAASGVSVGNTICLVCMTQGLGGAAKSTFIYDLKMRKNLSSITFKSVPEEWKWYSSAAAEVLLQAAYEYLFVPRHFARVLTEVEVRIRKKYICM